MPDEVISGVLNLDKPAGWTSFDVVAFVRRRCGVKRVGHAGTLDPAATGVLPLLLGPATRLTEYLVDDGKRYLATVELGVETDTYDREGSVLAQQDASGPTLERIEAALAAFVGEIQQRPPAYSAIKRAGEPSYKAARRGETLDLPSRRVVVHGIEVLGYESPFLTLDVSCGKGFYVRSLAQDLGQALGVGGTLASLRRLRVGPFRIEEAVDIETLRAELESDAWRERLYAPDELLLSWRAAVLAPANAERLRHGLPSLLPDASGAAGERCRAYDADGAFLGLLRCEDAVSRNAGRRRRFFRQQTAGIRAIDVLG